MGVFDNKGVQAMLVNMLKAAAPDLALQVEGMAAMVKEFSDRLVSVQVRQQQILETLQRIEAQNEQSGPKSTAPNGSAERADKIA
jgi:hypothetical protein